MKLINDKEKAVTMEVLPYHTNIIIRCANGQNRQIERLLEGFRPIDPEKDYEVSIKPKRVKRSLNANNYSWVLTDKLADKLNISKDECHRMMLARYGQTAKDKEGNNLIISALATIPEDILIQQLGYIAPIKNGWVGSKEFIHYRVLKGSSEFDTREMSVFIDGIVSECKEHNIETLTPDEIARMKAMWGGDNA